MQDEIALEIGDLAVGQLITAIKAGKEWAVKYYLENKGQMLGFGVRKLAFRDGEGIVTVPGVLIFNGQMSEEEWLSRYGNQAAL